MDFYEYNIEMAKAKANSREVNQQDFERYQDFASSVACLIAEGSEFMTKEQLYDAIKNVFNRVILKQEKDQCICILKQEKDHD